MSSLLRHLPSVDQVLAALGSDPELGSQPRALVRSEVNRFLDLCRERVRRGEISDPGDLSLKALLPGLRRSVREGCRPHFRRVLNATGVVVHTNMGRSLLAEPAVRAVTEACARYSNLEFDLETGERGSRYSHVEDLLRRLTGAESALVVNNNAAAVLIVLETMARGREVIVSRGQLVEIGGSFRIPEVMAKSGAVLREVGATNRTHLRDYESAIGQNTAALMRVHASNFRMIGFTKEVGLKELRALGDTYGLPVIEDLGSGNLVDFKALGLGEEPRVQDVVAQGADVVTFSGDKVLGGPQAGIIVGAGKYLDRIKENPLNRAVRIDKMTLAALEATLRLYLDPDLAMAEVPTLRMIAMNEAAIRSRAVRLARLVVEQTGGRLKVGTRKGVSRVGGGAFPERDLPTVLVRVEPGRVSLEDLRSSLLEVDPPLVCRVEDDALCLDARTLGPGELKLAAAALGSALAALDDKRSA
ncbi:MAG: L-seryl-tRNA(Sec) selenium transferase [Desulfovibrionaceae bacterium]|nr:L-seryl-tRNA(Sec) selenium transferase [Desulfovibrionaceae bacterium]